MVLSVLSVFVWISRTRFAVIILSVILVAWICAVILRLRCLIMKRAKTNPYLFSMVTFPEPWAAIRRPGVRLCLDEPTEIITAVSRYCVPVYTLSTDYKLTDFVKSYAHYFHSIKCCNAPDIIVSYLSMPRFVLAMRDNLLFRALVLSAPVGISEG